MAGTLKSTPNIMAISKNKVDGQPQLEAALNQILAAVRQGEEPSFGDSPSIKVKREGQRYIFELAPAAQKIVRTLYPYVVDRGGVYGVSLTPGPAQWIRQRPVGTTSQQSHTVERGIVLVHQGDPSTTYTKLDASPAPYKVLTAGTYFSWLHVSALRAEVKFVAEGTAPQAADGEYVVALNKFQLVSRGAAFAIVSVDVYEDDPQALLLDWKLGYNGAMTSTTTAYMSAGRVAYADWAGADVTGVPVAAVKELAIGGASVTASASHKVYAQINYSKQTRMLNGITVNYYTPSSGSIVSLTTAPVNTETTGHVLLAEFTTVKDDEGADLLWLEQRHVGVLTAPSLTGVKIDPGSSSSSGPSSSSSGSDKSTAIVPAPWEESGFAALFAHEMPDVRFDDVMLVHVRGRVTRVPIDPRYVAVCELGSILVCGAVGNTGAVKCARVARGILTVETFMLRAKPSVVTVRLTGVRRGFAGLRFPSRSRRQFDANEAFINSAYPRE